MAVESIPLRGYSEISINGRSFANAQINDYSRDIDTYNKRRKHHEDKLLVTIPVILNKEKVDDDYKFKQFCNELNDCYDTDMLLLICSAFETQIKDTQRYADYLFAKIKDWADKEARLYDYLKALFQLENAAKPEAEEEAAEFDTKILNENNISKIEKVEDQKVNGLKKSGQSILISSLTQSQFVFKQNNSALSHIDKPAESPRSLSSIQIATEFSQRLNESNYLNKVFVAKGTEEQGFWNAKQNLLRETHNEMQRAMKKIALFSWDKVNREQKFVRKVVDALRQKGQSVTLSVGVGFQRTSYKFNRNELLILVRSNPLLCEEFKKALNQPTLSSRLFGQGKLKENHAENTLFNEKEQFLKAAATLLGQKPKVLPTINSFTSEAAVMLAAGDEVQDNASQSSSSVHTINSMLATAASVPGPPVPQVPTEEEPAAEAALDSLTERAVRDALQYCISTIEVSALQSEPLSEVQDEVIPIHTPNRFASPVIPGTVDSGLSLRDIPETPEDEDSELSLGDIPESPITVDSQDTGGLSLGEMPETPETYISERGSFSFGRQSPRMFADGSLNQSLKGVRNTLDGAFREVSDREWGNRSSI